jgi:hypothetical protein
LFKHRGAVLAPPIRLRHPVCAAPPICLAPDRFAVGWIVAIVAWVLHIGALSLAQLSIVQAVLSGGLVSSPCSPSAASGFASDEANGPA